jgi:hypothetical protein
MKIHNTTSTLLQPSRRPSRPIDGADVLGPMLAALEADGWSVWPGTLDDSGVAVEKAGVGVRISIDVFDTLATICGGAPDDEDEVPQSDPPWDDKDRWESGPAIPPDAVIVPPGLTEEEQDWKDDLAPFSRNRLTVGALVAFGLACGDFDRKRGNS